MAQEKVKPAEVTNALHELGLTEQIIVDAVLDGESERDFCSPHHPKTMPGYVSWGNTIRALRDSLVIFGWTAREDRNYPTVVNEEGTVAVAVATGDEGTGRAGLFPNVKNSKGSVTKGVVLVNQTSLFEHLPDFQNAPEAKCMTWLLLRQRDGDRLYFELSLPARMKNGFILEWDTRIIFGPQDIDGDAILRPNSDDAEHAVEVRVVRKAQS